MVRWPSAAPGFSFPDSISVKKKEEIFFPPLIKINKCLDMAVIGPDQVTCLSLGATAPDWLILGDMVPSGQPRLHGPIQITWTGSNKGKLFPKENLGC